MISLNTENKLPKKLKSYYLVELALFMLFFSLPFMVMGIKIWIPFFWLSLFIGLPMYLYFLFIYDATKFVVGENKITINSGIFIKKSKSVAFSGIQNVENVKGILRQMFGLSTVKIWTSSPSQIKISKSESEHMPDGMLILEDSDADWLKNYILDKQAKQ